MVLTQSQLSDIQIVIDKSIKTILSDSEFLAAISVAVAKTVETNLKTTFEDINANISSNSKKISTLELQYKELVRENIMQKDAMENLKQYSRRNNLRIFGLDEKDGECTDALVLQLLREKLNLQLETNVIDCCHRIGKAKRHIIVKFTSYNVRRIVLQKRNLLKGTRIRIVEDLTKSRLDLLKCAEMHVTKKNTWSLDGNIWIKWNNQKQIIKSEEELQRLVPSDVKEK